MHQNPTTVTSTAPSDDEHQARLAAQQLDSQLHAAVAKLSGGLSPISLALAWADWALHLASQPGQAALLAAHGQQAALKWCAETLGQSPVPHDDPRFAATAWQNGPWAPWAQAQHAAEAWWAEATDLRGMSPHHQQMTGFFARQWLDMLSPTNAGLLNPEVLQRTQARAGANLVDGAANLVDGWRRQLDLPPLHAAERRYRPGADVAITPGQVVHRNHLVELIQYQPVTASVHAEPVFIVPSWIMKFYILDLSAENSLVNWLVSQGHTVFILSWRNPDESDALLGLDDYLEQGVFDALAAIKRLVPAQKVHACGYCLGGTLLALGAAALARPGRIERAAQLPELATVTLLAAETDFTEPGEMGVLIDESQVALLEDMMAERGFLSGPQMAGSFTYLHARELVWSQRLRAFWLGEPDQPNDLMAWNADTTRMPAVMHSEYLRRCYLRNEIAEGRFPVEGRPVSLDDLSLPLFVVGTEKDHVSPWKSVYKIHRLTDTLLTFVLTSGGHNAGIVSEPGHAHRNYALRTRPSNGPWQDPAQWQAGAVQHEGSWWPAWSDWLLAHGSGERVHPRKPPLDAALGRAPGRYVHQCYRD